jgi:hypothetical protein
MTSPETSLETENSSLMPIPSGQSVRKCLSLTLDDTIDHTDLEDSQKGCWMRRWRLRQEELPQR